MVVRCGLVNKIVFEVEMCNYIKTHNCTGVEKIKILTTTKDIKVLFPESISSLWSFLIHAQRFNGYL